MEGIVKRSFFVIALVIIGALFGSAIADEKAKIAVDVAVALQQGAQQAAPVLPDDFADRVRETGAPPVSWSMTEAQVTKKLTLRTSKGWPCPACDNQKSIIDGAPDLDKTAFDIIGDTIEDATGLYPRWERPDGTLIQNGAASAARIRGMISENPPVKSQPADGGVVATVDKQSLSAADVASALIEHCRRHSSQSNVSQGILPTVPVDLPDEFLSIIDGMLAGGSSPSEGVRIKWPEGERSIAFSPDIQLTLRKVVELDIAIDKITVSGREVTISVTSPRFCPDLKVRLK